MDAVEDYARLAARLDEAELFADKTWRVSPDPWPLSVRDVRHLGDIGRACAEFHRAIEILYVRSTEGRNVLRNGTLEVPWVAEYLNRGKPQRLIDHSLHECVRGAIPPVLRPDLLRTEHGWALTELDSVPGGIGLTAFLNRLYGEGEVDIVGADDRMLDLFFRSLAALVPTVEVPLVALVVSDEAATYRPEFEWLAAELRLRGRRIYCFHPDELMPLGKTICVPVEGNPERVDLLYRFFELFDLENLSTGESILDAVEAGELVVAPAMRPFQEEKLNLALFHHPLLEGFWRDNLGRGARKILGRLIPQTWLIEAADLPPGAVLDAPWVGGRPIRDWMQLGGASQKERNLIIKASGFHETAWGARSVVYGSDCPRATWTDAVAAALEASSVTPHILQEYRKPCRLSHRVFNDDGVLKEEDGRLRLCPFFFVADDNVEMGGTLATFCPADKKIIHGMRDAAMLPGAQEKSC